VQALAGDGGKLQRDILCAGRPAFKEAVDAGLHWCIMHWQTPYIWPQLVHLVQAALNTHAKGDTSEIECLLDMSRMRDASLAAGKEPDWTEIQAAAKFSMPPCSPYMGSLANYVRIQAPELITELSMFQKAFACNEQGVSRVLGGEFFNKLCNLQWGVAGKCPYLLLAAAEANLASPANRISDGICRLVTPGALAALTSAENRATAKAAERLMTDARTLCKSMSVPESLRVRLVGKLDVRIVCHMCKVSKIAEGRVFKGIGEIAKATTTTTTTNY
jgi:hypothetical protein